MSAYHIKQYRNTAISQDFVKCRIVIVYAQYVFLIVCKLIEGHYTLNNRVSFFLVLMTTVICCRSRHTQVEDSLKMDDH